MAGSRFAITTSGGSYRGQLFCLPARTLWVGEGCQVRSYLDVFRTAEFADVFVIFLPSAISDFLRECSRFALEASIGYNYYCGALTLFLHRVGGSRVSNVGSIVGRIMSRWEQESHACLPSVQLRVSAVCGPSGIAGRRLEQRDNMGNNQA